MVYRTMKGYVTILYNIGENMKWRSLFAQILESPNIIENFYIYECLRGDVESMSFTWYSPYPRFCRLIFQF